MFPKSLAPAKDFTAHHRIPVPAAQPYVMPSYSISDRGSWPKFHGLEKELAGKAGERDTFLSPSLTSFEHRGHTCSQVGSMGK